MNQHTNTDQLDARMAEEGYAWDPHHHAYRLATEMRGELIDLATAGLIPDEDGI